MTYCILSYQVSEAKYCPHPLDPVHRIPCACSYFYNHEHVKSMRFLCPSPFLSSVILCSENRFTMCECTLIVFSYVAFMLLGNNTTVPFQRFSNHSDLHLHMNVSLVETNEIVLSSSIFVYVKW